MGKSSDFIEEADNKDFVRAERARAELMHRVFVQSEAGAQLLALWKHEALMTPSVQPHYTQFEAGIAEGVKVIIRKIITQINSVES